MKKLLYLLLIASPQIYACTAASPNVEVNLYESPLMKIESRSVAEITKPGAAPNLGLFISHTENTLEAKTHLEEVGASVCVKVTDFKYHIISKPVMYIASETKDFACTYKRAVEHESRHYMHATEAINAAVPQFKKIIESKFHRVFIAANQNAAEAQIVEVNRELDAIWKKLTDTSEFDLAMDTQENFAKEEALCSDSENRMLYKKAGIRYE